MRSLLIALQNSNHISDLAVKRKNNEDYSLITFECSVIPNCLIRLLQNIDCIQITFVDEDVHVIRRSPFIHNDVDNRRIKHYIQYLSRIFSLYKTGEISIEAFLNICDERADDYKVSSDIVVESQINTNTVFNASVIIYLKEPETVAARDNFTQRQNIVANENQNAQNNQRNEVAEENEQHEIISTAARRSLRIQLRTQNEIEKLRRRELAQRTADRRKVLADIKKRSEAAKKKNLELYEKRKRAKAKQVIRRNFNVRFISKNEYLILSRNRKDFREYQKKLVGVYDPKKQYSKLIKNDLLKQKTLTRLNKYHS